MNSKTIFIALLAASSGLVGCAEEPYYYGPPPNGHVRWCLNHHPGYNPNTNLFPAADGHLYPCRGGPPPPYPPPPPPPP